MHNTAINIDAIEISEIDSQPHGQSMIEFALTIVIILVLLAGVVDLGRAIFTYLALRDAAQEGASYVSYDLKYLLDQGLLDVNGNVVDAVKDEYIKNRRVCNSSNLTEDLCSEIDIEVIFSPPPYPPEPPPCNGSGVEIEVSHNINLVTPFLGAIVGSQTIPVTASVTDTILKPACTGP